MRSCSAGMFAVAWFITSMFSAAAWRKVLRSASWNWMWRPIARSGQSSCSAKPACATASYSAGIAEHALLQLGKIREILVDEGVAGAAEAREAILDVGRVARLRQFAVIDDVDPGLRLLLHDVGDRPPHAHRERLRIDRYALFL